MRANTLWRRQALTGKAQWKTWKRAAILAALLLVVISPAWSDIRPTSGNAAKKLCYCDCDMKPHAKMCVQMCELPKYENRWWATSCLKKISDALTTPAPSQNGNSKKNNRTQDAKL